jgi:hypothetical protein
MGLVICRIVDRHAVHTLFVVSVSHDDRRRSLGIAAATALSMAATDELSLLTVPR